MGYASNNGDLADKAVSTKEQMILFSIGQPGENQQEYCIPILMIKEIREFEKPTKLPHSPHYVEGAINLRGNILPVINLATNLGVQPELNNPRRIVVIVEYEGRTFGLLVDRVVGITDISSGEIQPVSVDASTSELSGLVMVEDKMIGILRLDNIVSQLVGGSGGAAAMEF